MEPISKDNQTKNYHCDSEKPWRWAMWLVNREVIDLSPYPKYTIVTCVFNSYLYV